MQTKITALAIAAACGLAVGVLAGLAIATFSGGSLADMTAERDRLAEKVAKIERDAALAAGADEPMVPAAELEAAKAETKRATETGCQFTKWHLQTLSLLQMCIDNAATVSMIRQEEFRAKFKPEWYFPATAFDLIGGRWFLDEMLAEKVIDQAQHDRIVAGHKALDRKKSAGKAGSDPAVPQRLKTWRGTGYKTTDTFRVNSKKWRICWRSSEHMSVSAHRPNGDIVEVGSADGDGSTIVHEGMGDFYLDISAGSPYEVWVEELPGAGRSGKDDDPFVD